jgi:hypothetical protein
MKLKSSKTHLVKLPETIELVLFLIREELKANKFFLALATVGMEDSYYQPNFSNAIFAYAGFDDVPDELVGFYTRLLDKYTDKMEPDNETITEQAFNFYIDLMIEKRRRDEIQS